MEIVLGHFNFFASFAVFVLGLYIIVSCKNYFKKILGLSIFQVGVLLFYISVGKISGAVAPIIKPEQPDIVYTYTNPLPQVLVLTAIVVGVATLSVGIALIIRIKGSFGTIEEDKINV